MKELIEILQKIDTDFYNGGITFGQKYDSYSRQLKKY